VAALTCLGLLPLQGTSLDYFEHLLPYVLASELRLLLLNKPFGDRRRRQRRPLLALWRLKVMWQGLAPVYIVACCKALLGGRHRKPIYKVTRKTTVIRWYWRETIPQAILAAMVPVALIYGAIAGTLAPPVTLVCAGYWGISYSAALIGFVSRGWFGRKPEPYATVDRRRPPDARAERREPSPSPALTPPAPASYPLR
jgi:hypothetical protein